MELFYNKVLLITTLDLEPFVNHYSTNDRVIANSLNEYFGSVFVNERKDDISVYDFKFENNFCQNPQFLCSDIE
jgi:hypothetical protein